MNDFFFRSKRLRIAQSALWVMLPSLASASVPLDIVQKKPSYILASSLPKQDSYQINFNNIALAEYIRFIAKITNSNFIFDEADLPFSVTLVSEEPQTIESIFSTLAQILRINNLTLLEDRGNYIITKNPVAMQIPEIVSGEDLDSSDTKLKKVAPLITRIFRIKNTNINSMAALLRPMLSTKALIAVAPETNQLIITDIVTSIDKVASLLSIIDTPHSPFEIESYTAKRVAPKDLINLTEKIILPFTEGTPLVFVPQTETNSIFIVSTPYLIERALSILEDLDIDAKEEPIGSLTPSENVFLYKVSRKSRDELLEMLKNVAKDLKTTAHPPLTLISMLEGAGYAKDADTIALLGDPITYSKALEILLNIDSVKKGIPFLIYQPIAASEHLLDMALEQLTASLDKTKTSDPDLLSAMKSGKFLRAAELFVFFGTEESLSRLNTILLSLDKASASKQAESLLLYTLRHQSAPSVQEALQTLTGKLEKTGDADIDFIRSVQSISYVKEANALLFTGSSKTLAFLRQILTSLDTEPKGELGSFFAYSIKMASPSEFQKSLTDLSKKLEESSFPDFALIQALNSARYLEGSNTVLFTADTTTLGKLQKLLSDTIKDALPESKFFIYPLQEASYHLFANTLSDFTASLKTAKVPDSELIAALEGHRYIKETNSVTFTGSQRAINQLENLLPNLDPRYSPSNASFYIYHIQHSSEESLQKALLAFAKNLSAAAVPDGPLIEAITSMRLIKESHSLVFTGSKDALARLTQLMPTFDSAGEGALSLSEFFVYKPHYRHGDALLKALSEITVTLKSSGLANDALVRTLETAKWVQATGSLVLAGDAASIARAKEILTSIDIVDARENVYFLYKLTYASIDGTIAYLHSLANGLDHTLPSYPAMIHVIDTMKPIVNNQAILLSGESQGVDQIKSFIAQFDTPSSAGPSNPTVFIYKPKYAASEDLRKALIDLVTDLSKTDKINPNLLVTVKSARVVEANQTLAFSGQKEIIEELKLLLSDLDTPEAGKQIHHVGATTFLIYKLQYASASKLMASLRAITLDLAKGGIEDKDLARTINTMKWIQETNSILFMGTTATLQKVQDLAMKFDLPSMGTPVAIQPLSLSPNNYVIYNPHYKPGDQLIELLSDFEQNLRLSGINDPILNATIQNLRWMPSTCSLIISGTAESIAKIEDLLKQFDKPSEQQLAFKQETDFGETSFLIYKLQYHQGNDIRIALTKISDDLLASHKGQKIPMIDALNAIQWIPVTNSLVTSGPPDVLSKIRELILNLDVPLRQVFIEALILQTSLTNNQSLGLSWSGRGQYKNQFSSQVANFPNGTTAPNLLAPVIAPLNSSTFPSVNNLPLPGGFDLGVIGDIILHKGQTFFTLGSLIDALQTDTDSIIVTNPKFIAQDSKNATAFFGLNIPFTGSTITITGPSSTTGTSLEYRNVGSNLSITPTLGHGDLIILDVIVNLSSVTANPTGAASTGITTTQTALATKVQVPDNHFVCLTGQLQDTKTHQRNQVPCLGGLPLIGLAFSATNRNLTKGNLMIFLKPKIIKNFEIYKTITEKQEDLLKDVSGLPVLKEEIDKGLDWVKTPEDE